MRRPLINQRELVEAFRAEVLEAARRSALEAAQQALQRLKSPAIWGSRRGVQAGGKSLWGSAKSRPGFHSGQLYQAVNLVGPFVTGDSVYVGIGDINVLDNLRPPSFFVPGQNRTIKRNNSQRHGYWWYLEYGVQPNSSYRFVPVGLSPWSRRGVGRTKGMARINDWGVSRKESRNMLVPIARSPMFNMKKNLLPKRPAGAGSRFYGNAGVGFMVRSRAGGHPGVRPTYMFLRAQRDMERRFQSLFNTRLRAIKAKYMKKLMGG